MPDSRPEPKYAIGDVLMQKSLHKPQYDIDSTTVLSVWWSDMAGEYLYNVSHMEHLHINTLESSLFVIPVTLTNEEIFKQFLKSHRKYAPYKRGMKTLEIRNSTTNVVDILLFGFAWNESPEGVGVWSLLNNKWKDLCSHFSLTGVIEHSKV